MTVTTRATTIMTTGSRFTKNSLLERESIQERKIVRDDGEASEYQQHAQYDQQPATGHLEGPRTGECFRLSRYAGAVSVQRL